MRRSKNMNTEQQQPEPAYIDSDGKLRDDGLHDEMLVNPKANAAFQQLGFDAAIKRGMSRISSERCYGKGLQGRSKKDRRKHGVRGRS